MLSQKTIYSFGDQNLFILPVKNACGRTDRDYHGYRYIHLKALGIIITSELPSK